MPKIDYQVLDRAVRATIYAMVVDGDMPHRDVVAVRAMVAAVDAGVPAGFAMRHGRKAATVRCTVPRFFRRGEA